MGSDADFAALLVGLVDAGVEFAVVGGVAAVVQGVPTTTLDVDVVHARSEANVGRLLSFLPTVGARVRGHAPGTRPLPGRDALTGSGHQLLVTRYGAIDFLGAIEDGLTYEELLPHCVLVDLRGRSIPVLGLAKLAELKSRSSREKDRLTLALIWAVLEGDDT